MESKNHKRLALEASFFTLFGYGLGQVIRLANNLILTRLLVPEYFGIVSIANVFIQGINLFSDIGLGPSVIKSGETDKEPFINTVWTLQVVRGGIITAIALIISVPVAYFYHEPQLKGIIIFIGAIASLQGFNSVKLLLYRKELKQGALSCIDLSAQIFGALAGILFAYYYRSIWSLVIISLVSSSLRLFFSHFLLKGDIKPRLTIEKQYFSEILHFGKWIFLSTALTFVASQIDKILLGKLLTFKALGFFNIAIMFSELIKQIVGRLSSMVLFPLFSRYRDLPRGEYRKMVVKPRRILLLLTAIPTILLTCFGDYVITLLYDDRYYAAAWMLPILAIGMWPYVLYVSNSNSLYVFGKPQYESIGNFVKFLYMIILTPLVYHFFGLLGVIIVISLNDIPTYIVMNWGFLRENIAHLLDDLIITILLIMAIVLVLLIRMALHLGMPGVSYF